jgi:alpha-glucosidase (family GH31 glycosyl hydrolase)
LKSSIISLFDFNIFSVPMIGADICGFNGNTNEELCARWVEVGAFYPFSRDHNSIDGTPQELYRWESVTKAAVNALGMRYQLLPYFYTLFYDANKNGHPVVQSLWMNYPMDSKTFNIQDQFMLGQGVMISPVLEAGVTSVHAYFPAGLWYDFKTKALVVDSSSAGQYVDLSTELTEVNVHIAGGNILALQEAAMTTKAGRQTPFTISVALCEKNTARGALFWDDGEQIELTNFVNIRYDAEIDSSSHGSLTAKVYSNTYADSDSYHVGTITVSGKAMKAPHYTAMDGQMIATENWSFDASLNVITFKNLNIPLSQSFEIKWW